MADIKDAGSNVVEFEGKGGRERQPDQDGLPGAVRCRSSRTPWRMSRRCTAWTVIDISRWTTPRPTRSLHAAATTGLFSSSPGHEEAPQPQAQPFQDLIAANASTVRARWSIPNFIARKHGQKPVTYEIADMEEYLSDTYGTASRSTRRQVMLLSQNRRVHGRRGRWPPGGHGRQHADKAGQDSPSSFINGCERGTTRRYARQDMGRLGGVRILCLQQVAPRPLCLRGLPDRLPEGALPSEFMAALLTKTWRTSAC